MLAYDRPFLFLELDQLVQSPRSGSATLRRLRELELEAHNQEGPAIAPMAAASPIARGLVLLSLDAHRAAC